jgi:apolipoprotein D and lipocalin family protein
MKDCMFGTPPDRIRSVALTTLLTLVAAMVLTSCTSLAVAPLPTVASVDIPRYMGSWYEIAKLPNRFQASCASDTVARYRMRDDGIEVFNRCRKSDGAVDQIWGRATVVPGSAGARLRVSFFWPIYGDFWVLDLDSAYETVLVGEPTREYAWILSRSPTLDEVRLQALLARAQTLGFDRAAFVRTRQTAPIAGDGS